MTHTVPTYHVLLCNVLFWGLSWTSTLISDVIYGRSLFFEVDWHLVTENGSVTPICSLSPSLTVLRSRQAAVCLIGATVVAASDGGLCKIIHPKYRHYKYLKEDAIAVITHFCSKRWLVVSDWSAIWWWSEHHLTVFCIDEIVPSYVAICLNRVLQMIWMKLIFLFVWTEQAVLSCSKIALKFKYENWIG